MDKGRCEVTEEATIGEEKFLAFVVRVWPNHSTDVALDVNARWVGSQIGLTDDQSKLVVESLVLKGLLHASDLQGAILVHPTVAAVNRPKPVCSGVFARLSDLMSVLRIKKRKA
jgi:hypothetical protein